MDLYSRQQETDAVALVHWMGGRVTLHARLSAAGYVVTTAALNKWLDRRRIPKRWLAAIEEVATDSGQTIPWDRLRSDN